jgi:hypothetical protein
MGLTGADVEHEGGADEAPAVVPFDAAEAAALAAAAAEEEEARCRSRIALSVDRCAAADATHSGGAVDVVLVVAVLVVRSTRAAAGW